MVCTAWGPDLDAGLPPKETGVYNFKHCGVAFFVESWLTLIHDKEMIRVVFKKNVRTISCLLIWIFLGSGCQQTSELIPQVTISSTSETTVFETLTPLVPIDIEPTSTIETPTAQPSHTPNPSPTVLPSETPFPEGFGLVPDLRGIPISEARTLVSEAGFSFLFQDVLNPDVPPSTIIDQDPPAGTVLPLNEIIFLYRSFQALEMYAGGACQPLLITLPAGKLLYWVDLDEGVSYNVRTDFRQGATQVSDYRMYLMTEFDNKEEDSVDFKPLAPGRYVISLGPYEVSKSDLEQEGIIKAGCLWITPEDLN